MTRETCEILKKYKTIAVVGYKPGKISGDIAHLLSENGYDVVGVNPVFKGESPIKVYSSLKEIPHKIDIVDVFRRSEFIPDLIPDVLEIKPKVLWLQLGIRNDEAVLPALENGIAVIQDTCIKVEFFRCF
jgi:predicted CoA-binding protein